MMVPNILCIGGPLDGQYSHSFSPPISQKNPESTLIPHAGTVYVTYAEHRITLPNGQFSKIYAPDNMTERDIAKAVKKHFR